MRIACIGGGPAGLYFSILARKALPGVEIDVYERNRPDDTFGWGVVFSDETLGNFERADAATYAAIRESMAYWGDIETFVGDAKLRSSGHGFCGLSRKKLLQIFHRRCEELGVRLHFTHDVKSVADVGPADLVLAADGVQSAIRKLHEDVFEPRIRWGKCRFAWLGTTKPLDAFTFLFRENEHGLWQIHAYPFERGASGHLSTFIAECHEDVWRRSGMERASEADTCRYFEKLFGDWLDGHPILSNRSIWRQFPTVSCERWSAGNVVLIGDSAHTAHFSIGSGTKLAMEDAIALAGACERMSLRDVPAVLAAYESERRLDVAKLQRVAKTSEEWFESCARHVRKPPLQFELDLLTRSRRITWDNLRLRDPELVARVQAWFAEQAGVRTTPGAAPPPPMFTPFRLRSL